MVRIALGATAAAETALAADSLAAAPGIAWKFANQIKFGEILFWPQTIGIAIVEADVWTSSEVKSGFELSLRRRNDNSQSPQ